MNRLRSALIVAAAAALLLTGCAAPSHTPAPGASSESASADTFPLTITHAFGTTVIKKKPVRVATVSWENHEVPLALGVVPVGMTKVTWGDDNGDGVLPWTETRLKELGAKTPVLFDETDGLPFEAIANTKPDVILAAYSGLTADDYKTLSAIAPVVAYPTTAWGTSYEDTIRMNSRAMGMSAQGDALIASLHKDVATALDHEAVLKDKKILFMSIDPSDLSQVSFYTTHDTRPGFLASLGLPIPRIVTEESAKSNAFYATVSAEHVERFDDVDLIVTYGDSSTVALLQADPLLSKIPAVKAGHVAILENRTPLASSANPSPLSIPWGIEKYFAVLAAPLQR